jgi:hypothetical protein
VVAGGVRRRRRRARRQPARAVEPGRDIGSHFVKGELRLIGVTHDLRSWNRQRHSHGRPIERGVRGEGVGSRFQIDQDLKRRQAAVEGGRIGHVLRQARVGAFGDVAQGGHGVALRPATPAGSRVPSPRHSSCPRAGLSAAPARRSYRGVSARWSGRHRKSFATSSETPTTARRGARRYRRSGRPSSKRSSDR